MIAWFQSRYDKVGPGGTGKDYINCPLTKEEYEKFISLLLASEQTEFQRMGERVLLTLMVVYQ